MTARAAVLTIACSFLASASGAEPVVKIRQEPYYIQGHSEEVLRDQMRLKKPRGRMHGATDYSIEWSFTTAPQNAGGCGVESSWVNLDVVYHLPRWSSEKDPGERLHAKWWSFMKALRTHEDGHRDIAIEAARAIDRDFRMAGTYDNCIEAEKKVERMTKVTLARYERKQDEYDTRTRHGYTQGAIF